MLQVASCLVVPCSLPIAECSAEGVLFSMLRSGNPWPSKFIAHVSTSVRKASAKRPQSVRKASAKRPQSVRKASAKRPQSVRKASAKRPQSVRKASASVRKRFQAFTPSPSSYKCCRSWTSLLRRSSKVQTVTGHGAGPGGEALLLRGVRRIHECQQSLGCCTLG